MEIFAFGMVFSGPHKTDQKGVIKTERILRVYLVKKTHVLYLFRYGQLEAHREKLLNSSTPY